MYTSGFFNSKNGDRKYNAADINAFLMGLLSENGVYENVGNKLQVVAEEGMVVGIDTGKALINYFHFINDAVEPIALDESDLTLNRYDAIVLRYDVEARDIYPYVIKGTFATTPTKPNILRNTSYRDLCLAYVYVAAGVTTITQGDITDMRLDSEVCGFITGLIEQVDTSTLFTQYQTAYENKFKELNEWEQEEKEAFNTWFKALTEELGVITYIQEYKSLQTTESDTTTLLINIPEYDPTVDSLFVTNYGIALVENEDYTVTGTGETAQLNFVHTIIPNQIIECRVLKSVIGMK